MYVSVPDIPLNVMHISTEHATDQETDGHTNCRQSRWDLIDHALGSYPSAEASGGRRADARAAQATIAVSQLPGGILRRPSLCMHSCTRRSP